MRIGMSASNPHRGRPQGSRPRPYYEDERSLLAMDHSKGGGGVERGGDPCGRPGGCNVSGRESRPGGCCVFLISRAEYSPIISSLLASPELHQIFTTSSPDCHHYNPFSNP